MPKYYEPTALTGGPNTTIVYSHQRRAIMWCLTPQRPMTCLTALSMCETVTRCRWVYEAPSSVFGRRRKNKMFCMRFFLMRNSWAVCH